MENINFLSSKTESAGEKIEFLIEKRSRMKGRSLEACFDYLSDAEQGEYTSYNLGTSGLVDFINLWIKLNEKNLAWNDKKAGENIALPYAEHGECPRDKNHEGTSKDSDGRIRCIHELKTESRPFITFKTSYFDKL